VTNAGALDATLARAEAGGWAGCDPYDGLSSHLARTIIPLGKLPRFALSQILLRIPLARSLAKAPPTLNAKGLGLFLGATVRGRHFLGERAHSICETLRSQIALLGIRDGEAVGWGYPFPWQSRSFWAPAGTPNAVVTATVGWHLLDMADVFGDERARSLGLSAANYLAYGLNESHLDDSAAISYTGSDHTKVVNISALAARLLARAANELPSQEYRDLAERLTQFVLRQQRADGTWPYAADPGSGWEDSFHTGYVLEALLGVRELGISIPSDALTRGFVSYARFFNADGGARLYASPRSTLDAHSAAQGIITYATLSSSTASSIPAWQGARQAALRIASWARESLWLPSKGHFAYRINGGRRDEREFIRWVQAWIALAMATAADLEAKATVLSDPATTVGVA